MPAILSRLSILFINSTSRDLDNTKILSYKLFDRCLIVKLACVNAALQSFPLAQQAISKITHVSAGITLDCEAIDQRIDS